MAQPCAKSACIDPASRALGADGTNRAIAVCDSQMHVRWARAQLDADHPGHTVTDAPLFSHTRTDDDTDTY